MRLRSIYLLSYYLEVAPTWSGLYTSRSSMRSRLRQHLYPSFQAAQSCCGHGTAALPAQLRQPRHFLRCFRGAEPMTSNHRFHGSLRCDSGGKQAFVKRDKKVTGETIEEDVSNYKFGLKNDGPAIPILEVLLTHSTCSLLDPNLLTNL